MVALTRPALPASQAGCCHSGLHFGDPRNEVGDIPIPGDPSRGGAGSASEARGDVVDGHIHGERAGSPAAGRGRGEVCGEHLRGGAGEPAPGSPMMAPSSIRIRGERTGEPAPGSPVAAPSFARIRGVSAAEPVPGGPVAAPSSGRIRGEPAPGDRGERRRGGTGEPALGGPMAALPSAIRPRLFFLFFFLIGISSV